MRDHVDAEVRSRAVRAALGREPFDLLLEGGTVIDVGTGLLRNLDVGVVGSLISSVHPRGARQDAHLRVDCSGSYIGPGLIDMHVHFESSMLTPGQYASAVGRRGTTTVFCDPHELANVAGVEGVRYCVQASKGLPVRFVFQAPSCVPPQPGLELSGHDLFASDIAEMLSWPEMAGLAEVMDMLGVLSLDDRMVGVVSEGLASGKLVSGHAAGLSPTEIQAYLAAGIESDHEIFATGDVTTRLQAGMTVELRGMLDGLLPDVVNGLGALPELPSHLVLCTDDLFAATLLRDGGLDHLIRRLIGHGMSPVRALRLATYHAALRLGRPDLGLVAAGRQADLILLSDLDGFVVTSVYKAGTLIARDAEMLVACQDAPSTPPLDTVHLDVVRPEDFVLRVPLANGSARMKAIDGIINTRWNEVDVDVLNSEVTVPDGYLLQAVVHRHGRASQQVRIALVTGWGDEWTGAVASTVSHDTHNLVVFGRDPRDMAVAANAVIATQGGVSVAKQGYVVSQIALPIAGILSPLSAGEVASAQDALLAAAADAGLPLGALSQPLMQVFASCLACIPGPHLTDLGLIDGTTGELFHDAIVS